MYARLGALPTPSAIDLQRNVSNFHQRMAAPNAQGWTEGTFRSSIYGQALDPESPSYGRVNPLDPYMRADYLQGWWDAVTDQLLPANEIGAATFNYWLDQIVGGNPVPSDVLGFFTSLKDRNNIYRELNQLVAGILDGTITDHGEMARMSPMILCLGDLRKLAYIEQVGWPPNVAAWSPSVAEVYANTSRDIREPAYQKRLLMALFAAECDGYAEQAGIQKPFGGQWNDAMISGLLGLSVPHAQFTNDDEGHRIDVDAIPLPSLEPETGGAPIVIPPSTTPPGTQPGNIDQPVLQDGPVQGGSSPAPPPPPAPLPMTVHEIEYLDAAPVSSVGASSHMTTIAIAIAAVAVAGMLASGGRRGGR